MMNASITSAGLALAVALAGSDTARNAWYTADEVMPGCRHLIATKTITTDQSVAQLMFLCSVIVEGILIAAITEKDQHKREPLFCPRDEVTRNQAVRIVIEYFDRWPLQSHLMFSQLAVLALQEAWPCPPDSEPFEQKKPDG
jgi:Rap1a immunity proteins